MKERPILFSGDMDRALLDGRKTQTRRVIDRVAGLGRVTEFKKSDTPGYDWIFRNRRMLWNDLRHADLLARCPFGVPGDRLWVRETWTLADDMDGNEGVYYAADQSPENYEQLKPWRPSIHMGRDLCRLTLLVTDVRVERVQDITEGDAMDEGVDGGCNNCGNSSCLKSCGCDNPEPLYRDAFIHLWNSLAKPGFKWNDNPWVWVVAFTPEPKR